MNEGNIKINKGYGWAILLFILLGVILPFYESQRVISWSSPRGEASLDVFHRLVLYYSQRAQEIKKLWGWERFFQQDRAFWNSLKDSPLLFSEQVVSFSASLATIKPAQVKAQEGQVGVSEFVASTTIADNSLSAAVLDSELISLAATSSDISASSSDFVINELLSPPYNFLLLGDSFVAVYGGVGDILEGTLLKFQNVAAARIGKVSSGLARPDYFNWENQARQSIASLHPNIAVIMLGTNDSQSFQTTTDKGLIVYKYGTSGWEAEYRARVDNFLRIFQDNGILVYWLGLPIMRDPVYGAKVIRINNIYQTEIAKFNNVVFVDTWPILAGADGFYAASLPDSRGIERATHVSDGIHLTNFGGIKVVNELFRIMQTQLTLNRK